MNRGNRTFSRRCNPLLQIAHVRTQSRLISHRRGHPSEECGHFRTRLHESEDIIDEQQHVLLVDIAEVLGHGQSRQTHAHSGTRRFVHLTVHQSHFRVAAIVFIDHPGFDKFVVKVVSFAGALAHAAKHGHTTVGFSDVVDEFLNQHGFAHTGTTEQTDFTTPTVGSEQIDNLNPRLLDRRCSFQIRQSGSRTVNGRAFLGIHIAELVYGFAQDVKDATQGRRTHGDVNRRAGIDYFHASHETVGGTHRNSPNLVVTEELLHFSGYGYILSGCVFSFNF